MVRPVVETLSEGHHSSEHAELSSAVPTPFKGETTS